MTTLLARDVTDPKATRAINTGNFIAGVMGWFGYVFITLTFGYFQFMGPSR